MYIVSFFHVHCTVCLTCTLYRMFFFMYVYSLFVNVKCTVFLCTLSGMFGPLYCVLYSLFFHVHCKVCLGLYSVQYVFSCTLYFMLRHVHCTVCLLMYTVLYIMTCVVNSMFFPVHFTGYLDLYSAQFFLVYNVQDNQTCTIRCTVCLFMYTVHIV